MVPAANGTSRTCSNRVWIPNQTARLRITPTTAAVIAESAADNARLPRSRSMNGAPAKIHRKHGRKVTQVVRIAPKVAATSGGSPVASRKAARKPTNCVTLIDGPGADPATGTAGRRGGKGG